MSPPTPVRTRAEIHTLYAPQLSDPRTHQCTLKLLTQLECTFRISPTNNLVEETICIPFKRVFQRCLQPYTRTENGRKVSGQRWINIEVTDAETNESVQTRYGDEVTKFLQAEKDLVRWMELEASELQ